MTREPLFGLREPADDRSIIVVSDLHLGGQVDINTPWRLCRFLDYIREGSATVSDPCPAADTDGRAGTSGTKRILRPEKIILLGDIMELWDSRRRDRNCAFLDILIPLLRMRDMDADVVYVAGNHDEDIAELIESCDIDKKELADERIRIRQRTEREHPREEPPARCSPRALGVLRSGQEERPESLTVSWGESPEGKTRTFEICNRHYPSHRVENGPAGLNVGGIDYAFVHGQQFDREQITYSISQAIGRRFDPVDFFQDLASISVTRKMKPWVQAGNVVLAAALLVILLRPAFLEGIIPPEIFNWGVIIFGALTGIVLSLVFLYGIYLFGYARRGPDRVASADFLIKICVAGFIAFTFLLVWGLIALSEGMKTGVVESGILWGFFVLLFISSLFMLGAMTVPILIARVKRGVYNKWYNIRNKISSEVFKEEFDSTTYKYRTKVLIFGHTHLADFTKPESNEKVRLLVNTGTWEDEDPGGEKKNRDTFVYIDKKGVCLLRWNDRERKIECFCKKEDDREVTLCAYIARNNIILKDTPVSSVKQ